MSETWADAQFDLLEEAYNEIPIEAKARIEQLESLVRDMYYNMLGCDYCHDCAICEEEQCRWEPEMQSLGLLGGDAE